MNKRLTAAMATIGLVAGCLTIIAPSQSSYAADAANWDPGYIISDAQFYNASSMTVDQIQTFLNTQGKSCVAGTAPCLKDFKQTTADWAADAYCAGYAGAANESAATILAKVGKACGISPKVLMVTLQKENSLVTRTQPTSGAYQTAMGYGCPDGAACNTAYYGFYNQLYRAARQFKIYAALPGSFSYRAGATNYIQYNPSASCGSSAVYIQNQATASLYNYTPYQPNKAALTNLYGSGDSCSSYGNRNFWAYFTDWFGDPRSTTSTPPPTVIALAAPATGTVVVSVDDPLNVRNAPSTSGAIMGKLTNGTVVTITGYRVTPVVAVVDPDFVPVPQPSEVAEVFEVPLDYLMAPDSLRQVEITHRGRVRHVLEYGWPGQRIWGATAAILYNLRRRLEQVQ